MKPKVIQFRLLWHNSCYKLDITVNCMFRIYLIAVFVFSCVFYSNAQADIHFKEMGHDFGKIKPGKDTLWYNFSFTNTGNEPLVISDVKTSCDCTLAQWPKTPIMPGKTAIIRGGFKIENKSGTFEKNIIVITNTSPATTILTIKGVIEDTLISVPIIPQ